MVGIMKKTYINPETEVLNISSEGLLVTFTILEGETGTNQDGGETTDNGFVGLGNQHSLWDEE
jgi:hypothetical protein